jgi:hypothetical protein
VRHGLDGVRVFHTLYYRWVVPLAERSWPMWRYSGLSDPNHASSEELPDDEDWSHLDRVIQLKPKEKVEGKPIPLNASVVSKLVCSSFFTSCSFPLCFPAFLILSRLLRRGLMLMGLGRTFRRDQKVWRGRPPRRRRRMPGRRRKLRWLNKSIRRRRRLPGM